MYCVLVIDTRHSSSLIIEYWLLAMVLRGIRGRRGENGDLDLDLDIGGWGEEVRGEGWGIGGRLRM